MTLPTSPKLSLSLFIPSNFALPSSLSYLFSVHYAVFFLVLINFEILRSGGWKVRVFSFWGWVFGIWGFESLLLFFLFWDVGFECGAFSLGLWCELEDLGVMRTRGFMYCCIGTGFGWYFMASSVNFGVLWGGGRERIWRRRCLFGDVLIEGRVISDWTLVDLGFKVWG